MRIEQIDLRIVRLPLVRPFQTSSSRKDHLDHILVRVVADGVDRLGRVRQPVRPVLLPRDDRDLLAHSQGFPGARRARSRMVDHRRAGRALSAGQGEPVRPGRAGDGMLGRSWPDAWASRCTRCSGGTRAEILSGVSLGIEPGSRPCST